MRKTLGIALLLLLAASPPGAAQSRDAQTLEAILKRLDLESKAFRSMTANIEKTKVTTLVNDRSTETGKISVRRDDKMLIELTQPDVKTILRAGDDLFVYTPRTKRVEQYDLGKNRAEVEQFLLLGFGTSGGDLKKGYLVTPQGEPILDKKKTILLELTPKNEKVRNQISKIHLWIDPVTWLPVQQKFFETGSNDYFEIRFTSIVRNPKLPDNTFKQKWPKDVTRLKLQ